MWIFTEHGFFSLTRSREEPNKIQARARCKADAHNLAAYVAAKLDMKRAPRVIETPAADYRFRLILEPAALAVIMAAMVEDIGYSNFKGHIETTGQRDKLPILHDVWAMMNRYQGQKHPEKGESAFSQTFEYYSEPPTDSEEMGLPHLGSWALKMGFEPMQHATSLIWCPSCDDSTGVKYRGRWRCSQCGTQILLKDVTTPEAKKPRKEKAANFTWNDAIQQMHGKK